MSNLHLYSPRRSCCSVGNSICREHRRPWAKMKFVISASFSLIGLFLFSSCVDQLCRTECCSLTPQPCRCLSGCARRWRAPARVCPSDPGAALAPPADLRDEKRWKGQNFQVRLPLQMSLTLPKVPNRDLCERVTVKGKVADEPGRFIAGGTLQERQKLLPELSQITFLLPRSNSWHSCNSVGIRESRGAN